MSHEITTTDNVVLHREAAWHGLGIIVEEAPTPSEALKIGGFDWGVIQQPLYTELDGKQVKIKSHIANFRDDTKDFFSITSASYQPIQNWEVAEFCEALHEEGDVKCESVGTIQGGKKIWFLLKGEPFNVANGDEIFPYVCVSNGHDGFTTFRVTPTTVRTVCRNTLSMVIPMHDRGELGTSAISIKHTTNVMDRVAEARKALKEYERARKSTEEVMQELAEKKVQSEKDIEKFFYDLYSKQFGDIPSNPQDGWEERRREKAMSAYANFSRRFDDEIQLTGCSWWGVYNAYSGLIQHDMKARGKDDPNRVERRVDSNLFGLNQTRTIEAFKSALFIAG